MEKRNPWTENEDQAILKLYEIYGSKWKLIARNLYEKFGIEGRTSKMCRERWLNHLDIKVNKEAWTEEEYKILFEKQKLLGNKWKAISVYLPGRSPMDAKNKYNAQKRIIERRIRKEIRNKEKKLKMKEERQLKKQQIVQDLQFNLMEKTETDQKNDKIEKNQEKKQSKMEEGIQIGSAELINIDSTSRTFQNLEIKNEEEFISIAPKPEIDQENNNQPQQQKPLQFDLVSPNSQLSTIFSPFNGNSLQIPTPSSMIYMTPRSQSYFQFPATPSEYFKNASFNNFQFASNNKKIN